MKKIIVIGCPGSGKSVFSIALNKILGIPLFHLDLMYWNEDRTTVEKSLFLDRLYQIVQRNEWIIDGNYASTMELRLQNCDTVFFLDYPAELCLQGVRARMGKPRPDMPWIETQEDAEFMDYISNFNAQTRPSVVELLEKYSVKNIYVFKNREDADLYLRSLKGKE